MRQLLCALLSWMLVIQSLPAKSNNAPTFHAPQEPGTRKPTLREKALAIPPGSMVEIRMKNKEKLRGRLEGVSNDAVTVKLAKGDKIDQRKIAFDDIKSIKPIEGTKAGKTALYILAGVGVGLIILFVVALAHYKS